jgi:hypothetical protein
MVSTRNSAAALTCLFCVGVAVKRAVGLKNSGEATTSLSSARALWLKVRRSWWASVWFWGLVDVAIGGGLAKVLSLAALASESMRELLVARGARSSGFVMLQAFAVVGFAYQLR